MTQAEIWIARPTQYWNAPVAQDAQFAFVRRYEEAGYDGVLFFDTQNLSPEVYVCLAAAAKETRTIQLGTGVTNPVTRHSAATASAMATLQLVSEGRAYLGIGRGDSSLAYLGYAPAAVGKLEESLRHIQSYLRGESVAFPADGDLDRLNLAGQPEASSLRWLPETMAKVPVGVAATGPRVIGVASREADRVDLMLGASVERVKWGIEQARRAREAAGLEGRTPIAAYVNVVVDDDSDRAWRMAEGPIASQARFSAMHGKVIGPVPEQARKVFARAHASYNIDKHGQAGESFVTAEFAHEFGVYGPASYVIERLTALVELGIDRLIVIGSPDLAAPVAAFAEPGQRFADEVLPHFK